jgi:hypothetical protein
MLRLPADVVGMVYVVMEEDYVGMRPPNILARVEGVEHGNEAEDDKLGKK